MKLEKPWQLYVFALLCISAPIILQEIIGGYGTTFWLTPLFAIFLLTYRRNMKESFLFVVVTVFVYSLYCYKQNGMDILNMEVYILIVGSIIITWFGIGYVTRMLRKEKASLIDAHERLKKQSERLENIAFYDTLTGLPNRYMVHEYISDAIYGATEEQQVAVMFMDLDRFKTVNDSMGHEMGDLLLIQVAERLRLVVPDMGVLARQGGDEFILLLKNTSSEEISTVANAITEQFIKPFVLNGQSFVTSPSIGVSIYPQDAATAQTLIKNADQAMYVAKSEGGNRFYLFESGTAARVVRNIKIEQGLRTAIERDELVLYYQPKVDLNTKDIIGVEALIRWNHPEYGLVPPMDFIPVAEETGLIIPIGKWVILESCRAIKKLQDNGFPHLKVSVNVSLRQFRDPYLVNHVREALRVTQFKPEYLELEITESLMHNMKETELIMKELKSLGVKLSLDDFGTGFSSLNVLNTLPIDQVKIDKSFVKDMHANQNVAAIVKTIVDLGKTLNFDLIAEGVETVQQEKMLRKLDCDMGQGFLYSKPIPITSLRTLLVNNKEIQQQLA